MTILDRAAMVAAGALMLAVLAGWLAGLGLVASPAQPLAIAGWLADTASQFQLLYAAGLIPALGYLMLRRRWRFVALAVPFAASVAFQLWPYFGPSLPVAHAAGVHELRVAAFNVWYRNQRLDLVDQWLAAVNPDVLVLSEVTPDVRAALAPALQRYPYQTMTMGDSRADVLVASRAPLALVPFADPSAGEYLVQAHLCPVGAATGEPGCFWLIAAHTPSPASAGRIVQRDRLLAEIGDAARAHRGEPTLVMGDLNTTPWAPGFRVMLARGGLVDSARGHGLRPTWNAQLPFAQVPIDHVLVAGPVTVIDRHVGPDLGSDHLPVTARLRF